MSKNLKKALTSLQSPYFSELPYNLNWMPSKKGGIHEILDASGPISLVDVGCRNGIPEELSQIQKSIFSIGFDADKVECERLNQQPHPYHDRQIFPLFVSGGQESVDFHLYHARGSSSSLQPNQRYQTLFGGPVFKIEQSVRVQAMGLDAFFSNNPELPAPDFIKLDTQGSELQILEGAVEALQTCSMVEVEVEFIEMYERQSLFSDVMNFMLAQGFDLFHLNRVISQRRGFSAYAKGQLTFGDALFVRREDRISHYSSEKLLKLIVLLINYGYLDVAQVLKSDSRLGKDQQKSISKTLEKLSGRWTFRRFQKRFNPFIDKLILFLLWLRKTNGLTFDSDRSWPIR